MSLEPSISISEKLSLGEYKGNFFRVNHPCHEKELEYLLIQARTLDADYLYCLRNELEGKNVPFIYVYDERNKSVKRSLVNINRQIWTMGEIPLAIVVYEDEIKIIDTQKPITKNHEARVIREVKQIDQQLRHSLYEGRILEQRRGAYSEVSPYQILLDHISKNILDKSSEIGVGIGTLRRVLVKFILIRFLEEQKDNEGGGVFRQGYFQQFMHESNSGNLGFCDVLRGGDILALLDDLHEKFNGGIFNIAVESERKEINNANWNSVAAAFDGDIGVDGQMAIWKYYDFNLLPIEFISRLYEAFVISVTGQQKSYGSYYTPPHLARLLVDELLPFDREIDFNNFRLLDPACGSGIFLVLAFKRLVTIWMMTEGKGKLGEKKDIESIKKILSDCIYGVDINSDALAITATSLQIALASHVHPKKMEVGQDFTFEDLIKNGNLCHSGFFRWYKNEKNKFQVIIGNPPFNIPPLSDIDSQLEDDWTKEVYANHIGVSDKVKTRKFPQKNPSFGFLYKCLSELMEAEGQLFMILPSSFLYNSTDTASEFRQTIFSNWPVGKIFDFSPLREHLWKGAAVSTVAIYIGPESWRNPCKHIVVRNSEVNKDGATRFQVDKYDVYTVLDSEIFKNDSVWKTNLMGGGRLQYLLDSHHQGNRTIKDLLSSDGWNSAEGIRGANSAKKKVNLKGKMLLAHPQKFTYDHINDSMLLRVESDKLVRGIDEKVLSPPNLLIKMNIKLPIAINDNPEDLYWSTTVLGIKHGDRSRMERFRETFIENRERYQAFISCQSSRSYLQRGGRNSINSNDIKKLPIATDISGNPVPFPPLTKIERAIIEDLRLMEKSFSNTSGPLFASVDDMVIAQFALFFCEILNYFFENGELKFRLTRQIIDPTFVWVTFEHSKVEPDVQDTLTEDERLLYQEILIDTISNQGLSINRIIIYYGERNRVSFLKPNKMKYWTRSIGMLDAENVKADLFTK